MVSFEANGRGAFGGLRFSMLDLRLGGRMLVKHPALTVIGTIAVAFAIAVGAGAGQPEIVANVTASTFALTRVPTLMGRTLLEADERGDAEEAVVEAHSESAGGAVAPAGQEIRQRVAAVHQAGALEGDELEGAGGEEDRRGDRGRDVMR